MDKEHVKGAAEKLSGTIKDQVGKMTGDQKMRDEGQSDKNKGSVHQAVGDLKDAAEKVKDAIKR